MLILSIFDMYIIKIYFGKFKKILLVVKIQNKTISLVFLMKMEVLAFVTVYQK